MARNPSAACIWSPRTSHELLAGRRSASQPDDDASARSSGDDIIAHERSNSTRVVHENADFFVFCPYASSAPFELAIWPKRQSADFHRIADGEATRLADTLKLCLRKLNRALDFPALHILLTTAPSCTSVHGTRETLDEDFRWHIAIVPRLQPIETLELATGCHVNGVWPEVAADYLRSIADDS